LSDVAPTSGLLTVARRSILCSTPKLFSRLCLGLHLEIFGGLDTRISPNSTHTRVHLLPATPIPLSVPPSHLPSFPPSLLPSLPPYPPQRECTCCFAGFGTMSDIPYENQFQHIEGGEYEIRE
jgi:hypothetical protein